MTAAELDAAYAACEELAGRDKPHLYAAAQLFERPAVRRAFVATYASMRVIDDAIDGIPNRATLSADRRRSELGRVARWLEAVDASRRGQPPPGPLWTALADTMSRFAFPPEPWQDLAAAMSADVVTPSFRTWDDLRRYMHGASVAPAVVFMYLVLMKPGADGVFCTPWNYDRVLAATEDLAVFCYCVHILRDVAVDLTLGESGLVYLPEEDLSRFGLERDDLRRLRDAGNADSAYRRLAMYEAQRAWDHLNRGRQHLPEILAEAEPANGRALVILIDTYERILNELQRREFDVFAAAE